MTPYCVIGCTRGTGLQVARQLAARGAAVRCIVRDPVKARDLLPVGVDIRRGDVTTPLRFDGPAWAIVARFFSQSTSPADLAAAVSSSRRARSTR